MLRATMFRITLMSGVHARVIVVTKSAGCRPSMECSRLTFLCHTRRPRILFENDIGEAIESERRLLVVGTNSTADYAFVRTSRCSLVPAVLFLPDGREPNGSRWNSRVRVAHGQYHHFQLAMGKSRSWSGKVEDLVFIRGGKQVPSPGEDRVIVPSPKV